MVLCGYFACDLGQLTADGSGNLSGVVAAPANVPAGYHTLVLSGLSYAGQPITVEQVVQVRGSSAGDVDNDGVPDSIDSCLYVPPSGTDIDSDGIDDACDPFYETAEQAVTNEAERQRILDRGAAMVLTIAAVIIRFIKRRTHV